MIKKMFDILFVQKRLPHRTRKSIKKAYLRFRFKYNWNVKKDKMIRNINDFELVRYSQNGEDGIIKMILHKIGVTNRFFVEFGVEDGKECNTRALRESGWDGLQMDCVAQKDSFIRKELITSENINTIFRKYCVPKEFDVLSIDVDGNDYWIWKALESYSPRLVIIEYNSSIGKDQSRVMKYDPGFRWDRTDYFGASLLALRRLGESKGYSLIGTDSSGTNAFFVRKELVDGRFDIDESRMYNPPRYGRKVKGVYIGHPKSKKFDEMIEV